MSTDLVPADGGNLPAVNGDSAGFIQLSASVLILSARALLLKEGLNHLQREMEENATKTREFAEKCAQAEVDEQFVSLLMEAAAALQEVADATGDLSAAADLIQTDAESLNNAHEQEYRGGYEAAQASPYDQPKPGFLETC